ncbi:cytochrome P450 [Sporichthya sp.]|uniref:cytochrome P450 n=1 Tax=Sporichthya sp. TaxID=65475 RepID=UPI001831B23A|nr:cytochrome P450 [Sporichthya sp.]MBA3743120.1 cytochrome P450 [Sporichthya sp.]
MIESQTPCTHFSPLDPALAAPDEAAEVPSEVFWSTMRQMQSECPVGFSDAHGKGQWIVTRHDDVCAAFKDWQSFTSTDGAAPVLFDFGDVEFHLLPQDVDPPLHRGMRKLLNPYFHNDSVSGREEAIRELARDLIAKFEQRGSCEFMSEFAVPFPAQVFFGVYLGIPVAELTEVLEWVDTLVMEPHKAGEVLAQLIPWSAGILASRRAEPRDDVVTALVSGDIGDRRLTEPEQIQTLTNLIIGGLETTANGLGNAVKNLAADPQLCQQVRALEDKSKAVDEFLRFEAPAPGLGRTAAHDVELRGQKLAAGDRVLFYLGAGNRDPEAFEDPDVIDIHRRNASRHLSFGHGLHRCVGATLAELEMRVALEEVLDRLQDLRLDPGHPMQWRTAFSRGPATLHLTFTANSAGESRDTVRR